MTAAASPHRSRSPRRTAAFQVTFPSPIDDKEKYLYDAMDGDSTTDGASTSPGGNSSSMYEDYLAVDQLQPAAPGGSASAIGSRPPEADQLQRAAPAGTKRISYMSSERFRRAGHEIGVDPIDFDALTEGEAKCWIAGLCTRIQETQDEDELDDFFALSDGEATAFIDGLVRAASVQ